MKQHAGWTTALAVLPVVLLGLAVVWLPYLPNRKGLLGEDYSMWLPNLLAGYFWHVQNGIFSVPWFNPAQCGGIPVQADPQGEFFSLAQFLTFILPPMRAVQVAFFAFAAIGYLGAFQLARTRFLLSRPASVLVAVLFAFNSFYAGRMVAGHLSFSPFMLLPAAASCLIEPAGQHGRNRLTQWIIRCTCFGLLIGLMLEGGMLVVIPPAYLSLLMVLVLHAIVWETYSVVPLARLLAGTALGLCLCAGKLAAVLPLMAHVPRDAYPLPGYLSPAETLFVALRALFLHPFDDMRTRLANGIVSFQRHEFEYSTGPACLVLILASLWVVWRDRTRTDRNRRLAIDGLILLLLIPVALNTYGAGWTGFLKTLPVLRDSSSLLRWFAAYILPAVLGAGIALDRLAAARLLRPWPMAAAAAAATFLSLLVTDRSAYGPADIGAYNPIPIESAWHDVARSGRVPPVRSIGVVRDSAGHVDKTSLTRQDSMAGGESQLYCYNALFGYGLENFPIGTLHPGSILESTPPDASGTRRLNIKNPACYVFPKANACKPGDAFATAEIDQALRFADYRPFSWRKPVWAHLADWMGYLGWPLTLLGLLMACLSRKVRRPIAWP